MSYELLLLTLVNLLNYIDRYLISAVAPLIQQDLSLSNFQTGLLMSAFMLGYMIFSPIFGPLGDRGDRPRLMAVGVLAWSAATFCSGLVASFFWIVLARIGVGIGEASYSTIAPSLIRDRNRVDRATNTALAIFYLAVPLGGAIGYVLGGLLAAHFGWHGAFYIAALPGVVLGILTSRLADAPRKSSDTLSSHTLWQGAKELWQLADFRDLVFGYVAYTFAVGGFAAWAPKYGVAALGASLTTVTTTFGAVTVVSAVLGTIIGGRLGHVFTGRGLNVAGFSLFLATGSALALPFATAAFLTTSLPLFMALILIAETFLFAATAPVNTALMAAAPPALAATAIAVSTFAIHALGDLISPPLVGLLSDHMPMHLAMLILPVTIALSAFYWWRLARRHVMALKQGGADASQASGRLANWARERSTWLFFC